MATAVRLEDSFDVTDVPLIVRESIILAVLQAVCVFVVSLINKGLDGTADHALTGVVVAIGLVITAFLPGIRTRPRTIEGIAGAAGIGLGATWVFVVLDTFILQPLHTYTNRWYQIGGMSRWWYLPVWWMVGTYISWMGAWILANQTNRTGRQSLPAAVVLLAVLIGVCGAAAVATHFPGAGWDVPTFAVAALPALALGAAVSAVGTRRN